MLVDHERVGGRRGFERLRERSDCAGCERLLNIITREHDAHTYRPSFCVRHENTEPGVCARTKPQLPKDVMAHPHRGSGRRRLGACVPRDREVRAYTLDGSLAG